MAEPLKNQYGPEIPRRIAEMIAPHHAPFSADRFVDEVLEEYEELDLTPRARRIASVLHRHLPDDYEEAVGLLIASMGPKLDTTENFGMAVFLYLPHVMYIAAYGLDHFEASMQAQYEVTQRFSAEFSIRPFIEKYPEATMRRLRQWTQDASPHVRRLVSEGTRPRLPWAPRLRAFQHDPSPVLELLERLKDDPALYVRRSVANNLNDIGKDHPEVLVETARTWMTDADAKREWVVRHALRSAVKRGDRGALDVLGYGRPERISIDDARVEPPVAEMGSSVTVGFTVRNESDRLQRLLVDFRIHYVKANGSRNPKVFKLREVELAPGEAVAMQKKISLAEMTTRKHYPGAHTVDILLNGEIKPLGAFELSSP